MEMSYAELREFDKRLETVEGVLSEVVQILQEKKVLPKPPEQQKIVKKV